MQVTLWSPPIYQESSAFAKPATAHATRKEQAVTSFIVDCATGRSGVVVLTEVVRSRQIELKAELQTLEFQLEGLKTSSCIPDRSYILI